MATNVDVRGVPRGKCGYRSCYCPQYVRSDTPKCTCGHPPGVHENLTPVTTSSSTAVPPGYAAPYQVGNDAQYGNYQQYYQDTSSRPRCKAGDCNEPVFWDPTVGMFEYCTPKCRDAHLLPYEREKLNKDLQKFTDTLVKNAPPLPPPATAQKTDTRDKGQHQHNNPRHAQGAKSSSPDPPTKGKKSRQRTCVVRFNDVLSKGFGLIICERGYTTDSEQGFLITGVEKGSVAYKLFQDDQLRLLDTIVKFNSEPILSFRSIISEAPKMNSFSLTIDRSISLAPTAYLFSQLKSQSRPFSHILVLRSPKVFGHKDFGVDFRSNTDDDVFVSSVSSDTSSRLSGLLFDDRIVMCAKAGKQEIGYPHFYYLISTFKESFPVEKSLVIAIQRTRITAL